MSGRIKCTIHGCPRTRRNDGNFSEWICAMHWEPIPRRIKKLFKIVRRKAKKGEISHGRYWTIWEKCVEAAQENAWSVNWKK